MRVINYPDGQLVCGDNLEWLKSQPDDSIDMVFGSPPYEAQRLYRELNFNLKGDDWVRWMIERWKEMQRVSKGLVAMVIEGYTEDFKWSASPALLMADLHRAGFKLRKPPIYEREGIPGSGGPDWLKNSWEAIICTSKGRLPWADPCAMGSPPKYKPGGNLTNRSKDGSRSNQKFNQVTVANPGNAIQCDPSVLEIIGLLRRYTDATSTNASEVVRELRAVIQSKTVAEWYVGVAEIIRGKEILFSALYGGNQGNAIHGRSGEGKGALQSAENSSSGSLRDLRDGRESSAASSRRESDEQRSYEYQDSMSQMPCEFTQKNEGLGLSDLREEKQLQQFVFDSLLPLQKAWRSAEEMCQQSLWYCCRCSDVIDCGASGGGNMGCKIAHEGDAPFPEYLAEFFVRSFAPEGGIVLDPFVGTGTTISVARQWRRKFVGIDVRESEIEKCQRRLQNAALRQGMF